MDKAQCNKCNNAFTVYGEDRKFYALFDVPAPNECPNCRLTRRLMERNVKYLYYRKCDFTGKKTLSQFNKNQEFPVYSPEAWWSDDWDATAHGREFNFEKPFFEQFLKLKNSTPHLSLFNTQGTMQNSDYNNCTAYMKNCYLVGESDYCEECYYSNLLKNCLSAVDCSICYDDELCYECVDCMKCYALRYSRDCRNCRDSWFLNNCIACNDCIGTINQRNKRHMIFNKQYTKEEFEKFKKEFRLDTAEGVENLSAQCKEFFLTQPRKCVIAEQNQNSSGDHLFNSKNSFWCFDSKDLEDCRYCSRLSLGIKSSMDYNSWGNKAELIYQSSGCGDDIYNLKFCVNCHKNMRDCEYCYECFSTSNCFGCVGLKKRQYCILNKQYSKEEFTKLRIKIIEHMRRTGEWGEFFPIEHCANGYNESLAMDVFPMTKEAALKRGYKWYEEAQTKEQNANPAATDVIKCKTCAKHYKIIPQEERFYKFISAPIPLNCPACRHAARISKRNSPLLWQRQCDKCGAEMYTSYPPGRPEIVYCEKCYLEVIY